jgi:hypothetical protein
MGRRQVWRPYILIITVTYAQPYPLVIDLPDKYLYGASELPRFDEAQTA